MLLKVLSPGLQLARRQILLRALSHQKIARNAKTAFYLRPAASASYRFFSDLVLPEPSSLPKLVLPTSKPMENVYMESEITVSGADVPKPFLNFNDYDWPTPLKKQIEKENFPHPTPIQCQAWPIVLEGRDMVGIAGTGTGKTWAYMLPAMVHIDKLNAVSQKADAHPRVLVIAPTRELVQQIQQVTRNFKYHWSQSFYGGASRNIQLSQFLENRPQIVIATPGRLIDFVSSGEVDLSNVSYLVIDEADRLLEIGFEEQIRFIASKVPKQRQTLMWSATWPNEVEALSHDLLRDFVHVTIGNTDLHANTTIDQQFLFTTAYDKRNLLIKTLKDVENEYGANSKILIFTTTQRDTEYISDLLNSKGFYCNALHGRKTQAQRSSVISEFRQGRRPILIATDVASRGLDVKDVKVVINYDMPKTAEDYVHRVGRTGRQGNTGKAISFVTDDDSNLARDMVGILESGNKPVPQELRELANIREVAKKSKFRNRNQKLAYFNGFENQRNPRGRDSWRRPKIF